jgi:hypothetical protein
MKHDDMIVTMTVGQLQKIVTDAVVAALDRQPPEPLLYDSREAAIMLGVPHTWLERKARENKVPFRRLGHYKRYSREDIEQIAKGVVDPPAS